MPDIIRLRDLSAPPLSGQKIKIKVDKIDLNGTNIPDNIETTDHKNQASGYAGLDVSSKLTGSQQVYGTGSNTACEGNDSRLSDARVPTAHAASHITGQSDAIQSATAAQNGLMTSTYASKLDGIEASADVTDSGNVGSSIHGVAAKDTPIDNDEVALIDSAASNVLKKTLWSAVKSTLKSYFDTLYILISGSPAQGDIIYHNGTNYTLLTPGTNGQYLKTQGAAANPLWSTPAGAGDTLAPATNTDNKIPQWDGANSKTLKDGLTAGGASGLATLDGSSLVVQNPANATATPTADKIVIADGSGKVDGWLSDASTTAKGKVELAIASEVTTGTSDTLAVTPDALAGSTIFGAKSCILQIVADDTDVDTTSGVGYFRAPQAINGMNLIRAISDVTTAGTTNATTIQVRNMTKYSSNDALSSAISIASGDVLATAGTVDTSYDDVATNDLIKVYVTANSTTKPKGLRTNLEYQLP